MLEVINRYIHGFVSIPVILACRGQGLFAYFKQNPTFTLFELSHSFDANEGHLQVALRLFESLGWLRLQNSHYHVLITSDTIEMIEMLPKEVIFIYQNSLEKLFKKFGTKRKLSFWLKEGLNRLALSSPFQEFLEGVFIVPLLIYLKKTCVSGNIDKSFKLYGFSQKLAQSIYDFLVRKSWILENNKEYFLTDKGKFMLERAFNMATAASYAPMLGQIPVLLFGNSSRVFKRDIHQHETHIDRYLNVLASGFQHEKYFNDLDTTISLIFNQESLIEQPKYIIDMGCGDGTLLKRIYSIVQRSFRGLHLETHPLIMIGVDYNQASLLTTEQNLKAIPHRTIWGDINKPEEMLSTLQKLGLSDLDKALHVRSFLDHDRPFIEPEVTDDLNERFRIPYEGVYVNQEGGSIPPAEMVQSMVEHFKRWGIVVNKHGLIILEVHSLNPHTILKYIDDNESLHFDALQAFSGQNLVTADVFLMSAAEAGLFPRLNLSKRYPQVFPYTRITQNYFEKRFYSFEHAKKSDIPALVQLEAACWQVELQATEEILLKRIENYPEGQIVVKTETNIVGVIYTQRIADVDKLRITPFHFVHTLHDSSGSILQLLAINISPKVQDRGIGDELLTFVLHWSSLKSDIEKVVGVTRCANYKENNHISLQEYIKRHNNDPKGVDSILRFHTSHGARILDILPKYRPEDLDNKGAGILIEYDIRSLKASVSDRSDNEQEHVKANQKSGISSTMKDLEGIIYTSVRELLPQKYKEQFSPMNPLRDMGFDSLALLELRTLLNKHFNIKLDTTFFFQHGTPAAIVRYFQDEIVLSSKTEEDGKFFIMSQNLNNTMSLNTPRTSDQHLDYSMEPIAIVGMACRFPGNVNNIQDYWKILESGADIISKVPSERLEICPFLNREENAGFLSDVDKFDVEFFNISPREAELMDPQQRILLEVAWEALEHAGLDIKGLQGTRTGVFVGIFSHDYETIINKNLPTEELDIYFGTGNSASVAAGRLSYVLGLQGPAMAINTACSSSLVAVHLACQSLRQEESNLAIAGGVNLILSPELTMVFSKAGMLSPDGRCKTFDDRANGYVRSEGCGLIILKKLSKAISDGDNVLAVLRGTVINQDGASNGLTAPNLEAQKNLLQESLSITNLDPQTLSYIEAHGTGTSLGDPVEVKAIETIYGQNRTINNPLYLGSVKSNLGHTEAVAGIAGLIKVILALQHRIMPPQLHFKRLNPHIELEGKNIIIPTEPVMWGSSIQHPRRAAVSSFGFSGTNAHVIVEEHPLSSGSSQKNKPGYVICLSAKNSDSLKKRLKNLYDYLREHADISLEDIAYTLNAGRSHFNHRCALVVGTLEELIGDLEKISNFNKPAGFLENIVERELEEDALYSETLRLILDWLKNISVDGNIDEQQLYRRKLEVLASLYVKGYEIDWQLLHYGESHHRIYLPSYPFLRERYWIPQAISRTKAVNDYSTQFQSELGLHPLIDTNISILEEQAYSKLLTGHEFYLADHLVNDTLVLPGVAYLEMAYAAGKHANPHHRVVSLRNITWLRPIESNAQSINTKITLSVIDKESISFEVSSIKASLLGIQASRASESVVHAQGKIIYETDHSKDATNVVDLRVLLNRCNTKMSREAVYLLLDKLGLHLGPSFLVIQEFQKSGNESLARLQLPEHLLSESYLFTLHPCLLDGALQTALILLNERVESLHIPFNLAEIEVYQRIPTEFFVHTILKDEPVPKFDIQLVDKQGKIIVNIKNFSARAVQIDKADSINNVVHYYRSSWKTSSLQHDATVQIRGSILVFDEDAALTNAIRHQAPRYEISYVKKLENPKMMGESEYSVLSNDETSYIALLQRLTVKNQFPDKIIYRINNKNAEVEHEINVGEKIKKNFYALFCLCRALMLQKPKHPVQILVLNEQERNLSSLFGQALGGFARVLKLENPLLQCRLINIEGFSEHLADTLLMEFQSSESEVLYDRHNKRLILEFLENNNTNGAEESFKLRQAGVYLITGGAGGLGLIFAEFLVKHYEAKLILTGRSALSESKKVQIANLGTNVHYIQANVADKNQVNDLLQKVRSTFGPLNGLFHCAGVTRDALIVNKINEEIDEVLSPKIDGTLYLDMATKNEPLDFFVVFSSIVSILGNIGQSDYAYANSFMDGFAAYREELHKNNQRPGKTLVINWPVWEDGGMQINEASLKWMKNVFGLNSLKSNSGVEICLNALRQTYVQQIVLPGQKQKINVKLNQSQNLSLDFGQESQRVESESIQAGSRGFLEEKVKNELLEFVSAVLKYDIKRLKIDKPLGEYGIDSIGITTLTNKINAYYKLELSPAILFEHGTINNLLQYLFENYFSKMEAKHGSLSSNNATADHLLQSTISQTEGSAFIKPKLIYQSKTNIKKRQVAGDDIAVIGMSGIFPGSPDLEIFWENLAAQKDLISEIPNERWDWKDYYGDPFDAKIKTKWAGFIEGIDKFDAGFFNISPREAELMDPQQRLMLKVTWQAFENAGYDPTTLSAKTGLFIGVATNDYNELLHQAGEHSAFSTTGTFFSILANRVSYALNLQGPSIAIDTACSSSLIAIHNAVQAIQNGDCELAIAGGVNALLTPAVFQSFSQAGMLSDDGRCMTFDKRANGYARGEGAGAILLKPLQNALNDNDTIYGVIKGTAVNHGGHVSSLTVPNLNAQADLIVTAILRANIGVDTISYIETHGTGTSLGDPIEVNGLKKAFRLLQERQRKNNNKLNYCGLGTVKTNIGHLEAGAGIAGVMKVLLAMQHKKLPGILHFQELNPYIKIEDSPFYIVDKTRDWIQFKNETGETIPRRAGISSFGFGGANAHIVIEEAPAQDNLPILSNHGFYIFTLSAKNKDSLTQKTADLLDYLLKTKVVRLDHLSYTLNAGRKHFEKRFALIATSIDELKEKLQKLLSFEPVADIFTQNEETDPLDESFYQKMLRKTLDELNGNPESDEYQNNLVMLAKLYIKGFDFDWNILYQPELRKRISLPTYPFLEERYWIASNSRPVTKEEPALISAELQFEGQMIKNLEKILESLSSNQITANQLRKYIVVNE